MAVPAVCYAVQNNLIFYALHFNYISGPYYQLLCNIKIVLTALLFRVVLKKALTVLKWL